jgi:sn-glycerol 3-phosphate transport system substrate-binding protein
MFSRKRLALLFVLATFALALMPAAAQDPANVAVWIAFGTERLDWTTQKAAQFNAAFPQYNVTVEGGLTYEGLDDKIKLASEQGTLPGIVQYNEVSTTIARDSGNFKSIADALGDRTEVNGVPANLDDFVQPVSAYYTLDGKFTSMPWNASSSIMFSNMNILTAAGVDTPPATWAEVDAACEKIMATDGHPTYCITFPNYGWFFEQWLAQQNAPFANNDNGRTARATEVAFNNDAGVATLTWLKSLYDKGYLYYSGKKDGDSWQTVDDAFLPGTEVAMAIYSSSDTAYYTNTGKANGFDVAASRLPYNQDAEGGWTGNIIGGGSLWLVNGLTPEQEDGALTFLLWLTDTNNAAEWHQVTGYFPIRQSAIDLLNSDAWYDAIAAGASDVWKANEAVEAAKGTNWFETNPNYIVAAQQVADSQITPATQGAVMGAFPDIRSIVTTTIDKVLLTPDADPKTELDAAAADSNKVLSEYEQLNAPA